MKFEKVYKDGSDSFSITEEEALGYLEEAFGAEGAETAISTPGDWNCGLFYVRVSE